MSPTKDEIEQENRELRARVAELEQDAAERDVTGTGVARPRPARPTNDAGEVVLSEGERQALEEHGVTVSPFTGELLNALDEGVEPATPQARRRAERAHHAPESVPDSRPLAGPADNPQA